MQKFSLFILFFVVVWACNACKSKKFASEQKNEQKIEQKSEKTESMTKQIDSCATADNDIVIYEVITETTTTSATDTTPAKTIINKKTQRKINKKNKETLKKTEIRTADNATNIIDKSQNVAQTEQKHKETRNGGLWFSVLLILIILILLIYIRYRIYKKR